MSRSKGLGKKKSDQNACNERRPIEMSEESVEYVHTHRLNDYFIQKSV